MDKTNFKSILENVGASFLKFTLNYDGEIVYESILNNLNFNELQHQALQQLRDLILEGGKWSTINTHLGLVGFLQSLNFGGVSIFNEFRRSCKGQIFELKTNDEVIDFLIQKSIDIYPALLIRPVSYLQLKNPILHGPYFPHNEDIKFIELLRKDQSLRHLVLDDFEYPRIGFILQNDIVGLAFGIDLYNQIIIKCFKNCCYRMKYAESDLANEIINEVGRLRKLGEKDEIEYSTFYGIYGLGLDIGEIKLLDNCIIRNIDSIYNPSRNISETVSLLSGRKEVIGCVIEISQKIKGKPLPKEFKQATTTNLFPVQLLENIKASIALSFGSTYAPIREVFEDNNLSLVRSFDIPLDKKHSGISLIDQKHTEQIREWLHLLMGSNCEFIKVPLKRLLFAIYERNNVEDSLLDAFIAWEGMFSAKFETLFQVTSSIAKLLEPDLSKREIFVDRLKKLYGLRSNLAHGDADESKLLKKEDIHEIKNEVITIGINCIKALLKTPSLLNLKPEERVKKILIFS